MKISKTLLRAIMVAVTVGAITSCTKSVDKPKKTSVENKKTESIPDGCPACGMG